MTVLKRLAEAITEEAERRVDAAHDIEKFDACRKPEKVESEIDSIIDSLVEGAR